MVCGCQDALGGHQGVSCQSVLGGLYGVASSCFGMWLPGYSGWLLGGRLDVAMVYGCQGVLGVCKVVVKVCFRKGVTRVLLGGCLGVSAGRYEVAQGVVWYVIARLFWVCCYGVLNGHLGGLGSHQVVAKVCVCKGALGGR